MAIGHSSFSQGSIDIDTNIQMGVVGTEHVKITSSAFSVHNGAGSTPLIYADFAGGNVGIGTSTPAVPLEVNRSSGDIAYLKATSSGNSGMRIWTDDSSEGYLIFRDNSQSSPGAVVYDHLINRMSFKVNNKSDVVAIDSNGNVGIGTTTPETPLNVVREYSSTNSVVPL